MVKITQTSNKLEGRQESFMHVQTDGSSTRTLQKKERKEEEEESFLAFFHSLFHLPRIDSQLSILAVKGALCCL